MKHAAVFLDYPRRRKATFGQFSGPNHPLPTLALWDFLLSPNVAIALSDRVSMNPVQPGPVVAWRVAAGKVRQS
jgi:hypothetical protein